MKISGFTIVRNAVKYRYPVLESIRSILPACDEFIINVGDSEDRTAELIRSIKDPKIRIIENTWDFSQGKEVLSRQTNLALQQCRGDWAFYLQSDEVVHERDLGRLRKLLANNLGRDDIDAIRFRWLHFFGSYYRYRIDAGWYQKQDRVIRNNGQVESTGDAYGFGRRDGQPLRRLRTPFFIYHYGWVHHGEVMTQRRLNAERIGFARLQSDERQGEYEYGHLGRFPVYYGTHPAVMKEWIAAHELSRRDWEGIKRRYWWHPARWLRWRYKTWRRQKQKVE